MKNKLDRNFFISFVILIFKLFIIAFIVTFVVSLPLLSLDIISNFWEFHFCYSSFTFIYFTYVLVNKNEGIMFDFLLTKDFKDDTDLNTYNEENTRENMNSIKNKEVQQFCYDSSNPCPYCDTQFRHTALHCAVYFSDVKRLKEVIELCKKIDKVDVYTSSNISDTFYNHLYTKKDLHDSNVIDNAIVIGNVDIIKLLIQQIQFELYHSNKEWMLIDPKDDESIKQVIDLHKYKKHTQTGKDILHKTN